MRTNIYLQAMRSKTFHALTFVFVLCVLASAGLAQEPSVRSAQPESLDAGALVIPMDGINKRNTAGTTSNLRAYGLANLLIENNVPVKWAVSPEMGIEGRELFATASRVDNKTVTGGVFIILAEYDNQSVRDLIASFNSNGAEVPVYRSTEPTMVDVRYTLTRKPKLAVGLDGSNSGEGIRKDVPEIGAGENCGPPQATALGYKSVRRSNIRPGGPSVVPGDTLEWTIDFINNCQIDITGFNIRDEISVVDGEFTGNLTLVPGSNIVTVLSGGATGSRNAAYDGIGDDSTSDMLAPGAILPVGGRIQMKLQTTINLGPVGGGSYPDGQILYNQALGRGNQISGTVKTDAIDWTNTTIFGIDIPSEDSLLQLQDVDILNATIARIKAPTRADAFVEGQVRTAKGNPIANALVMVTNAATGELRTARTNALGNFMVDELEVGDLYIVAVQHKRYVFNSEPVMFTLVDNVTGLAFVGVISEQSVVGSAVRSAPSKAGR
ncbi:MAG: carboxypeptidase regulatory-like domain-containing protein [Chloracidobacterium sp.]|nr:carboxypeptidase regulatory-like domain-containing protein [Chloracidobacterium sp.]